MRAVAVWGTSGEFTPTPLDGGFFSDVEFYRLFARAFVRTVTKGWMAGSTAGTPPVGAGLDFADDGLGSHAAAGGKLTLE
jgi:hypothetical protein